MSYSHLAHEWTEADEKPRLEPHDVRKTFYNSPAWRRLRYVALRANRLKHGQLTCVVCGTTQGPWHVDHIVPLSRDWSRRLDATNLQVACKLCNLGKSNTDSLDWRMLSESGAESGGRDESDNDGADADPGAASR